MEEETRFKSKSPLRDIALIFTVSVLIVVLAPAELTLILIITFLLLFSIWKKNKMSVALFSILLAFSIYSEINTSSYEEIRVATLEKENSQCINVLGGYQEDISNGLIDDSYSLESGYSAYLGSKKIKEIQSILPSYTNPQIVSAKIKGPDITSNTIVGTWAIQDFDGFKRITPLNINALKYSFSEASNVKDSAAGRLKGLLDKFSQSTNTFRCSFQDEENNSDKKISKSDLSSEVKEVTETDTKTSSANPLIKKPKNETIKNLESKPVPLVCEAIYDSITPALCARKVGEKVEFMGTAEPETILVAYIKFLYGSSSNDWIEIKSRLVADKEGNFFIPAFDILDGGWALKVKQDFNGNFSNEVAVWK